MERIAPAHVDSPFDFHFRDFPGSPDPVLVLDEAAAGYDGVPVLANVKLTIEAGARIGLLGRNGAGKTTLVKLAAGLLPPLAGSRREGKGLRVGYFAQHTLEVLRPDETPLQHLRRLDGAAREQALRDFLGSFDFSGDMALAPVEGFSGGERARLALALVVWQQPNLLLLDEPTNHLDLDMREAVALALQEYEGAMVLVSHDRHLLRTATDTLMLVADGALAPFDGDLDDYRDWLAARRSADKPRARRRTVAPQPETRGGRGETGARPDPQAAREPAEEARGGDGPPHAREIAGRGEARLGGVLRAGRPGRSRGGATRPSALRRGLGEDRERVAARAGRARGDRVTSSLRRTPESRGQHWIPAFAGMTMLRASAARQLIVGRPLSSGTAGAMPVGTCSSRSQSARATAFWISLTTPCRRLSSRVMCTPCPTVGSNPST